MLTNWQRKYRYALKIQMVDTVNTSHTHILAILQRTNQLNRSCCALFGSYDDYAVAIAWLNKNLLIAFAWHISSKPNNLVLDHFGYLLTMFMPIQSYANWNMHGVVFFVSREHLNRLCSIVLFFIRKPIVYYSNKCSVFICFVEIVNKLRYIFPFFFNTFFCVIYIFCLYLALVWFAKGNDHN